MLFKILFRNIFRHKGKLIINTLVVMVASCLLVIALGQIGGISKTLSDSVVNTLTGHLVIKPTQAPVNFFQFTSSRTLPLIKGDDVKHILQDLASRDFVVGASERLRFGSLIGDETRSSPAMVLAVNPETEAKVCPDLGAIIAPLKTEGNALISKYLSRKAKQDVGSEIVLFSETPNDTVNAYEVKLSDYINTPVLIDEYSNQLLIVNLQAAKELLYLENEASEIVIRVGTEFTSKEELAALKKKLQASLSEKYNYLSVYTYYEVEDSIENISVIAKSMGSIQVGTIIVVMLVTILLLTSLTLHERRFEIGMLISIGMTPGKLTTMFILEVLFKLLLGYFLGFILGLLVLFVINSNGGIHASQVVEQYMYGGKVMVPIYDIKNSIYGGVFLILTSLALVFATCHKAARKSLVELLNSAK